VEWSATTWLISVTAVFISGAIAWTEGNWTRRPGLAMGFANHGGMWGDLVLLSMANAVVVPHLSLGRWIVAAVLLATLASLWVHRHWYTPRAPDPDSGESGDHLWPRHARGWWWRDLSWSGWAHVVYVIGELTLLIGFLLHSMPVEVVILVTAIFTIHVPIGLLHPRWFRTGHIATVQEQPLLAPLLLALWAVTFVKLG
jgi:hypothetical protein